MDRYNSCFVVLTDDYLGWGPSCGGFPGLRWSIPRDYQVIPLEAIKSVELLPGCIIDDPKLRLTCNEEMVTGALLEIAISPQSIMSCLGAFKELGIPEKGISAGRDPSLLWWRLQIPQAAIFAVAAVVFLAGLGLTFAFEMGPNSRIFVLALPLVVLIVGQTLYIVYSVHRNNSKPKNVDHHPGPDP